jgi:hypothetical protein
MASNAALRWLRALMLASVLFSSGLAGHASTGGVTPAASALIPLFALTVLFVVAFVGTPIGPACAGALLLGGQGLLHGAFQLLGGSNIATATTMCGADNGVAAMPAATSSHLMTHAGGHASHDCATSLIAGGHLAMLLAHLAAAVVVGVWLAAGERALWTMFAFTARRVVDGWRMATALARALIGTVVVGPSGGQPDGGPVCVVRRSVWASWVAARRGPPVTALA